MDRFSGFPAQMQNQSASPGMYLPVYFPLPTTQINYIQVPQHALLDGTLQVIPPDLRLVQVAQTIQPNSGPMTAAPVTGTYYTIPSNQLSHVTMLGQHVQQAPPPPPYKEMPSVTQYVIHPVYKCGINKDSETPPKEASNQTIYVAPQQFSTQPPKTVRDSIRPTRPIRPKVAPIQPKVEPIRPKVEPIQPKMEPVHRPALLPPTSDSEPDTPDKTHTVSLLKLPEQAVQSDQGDHACEQEAVDTQFLTENSAKDVLCASFVAGESILRNAEPGTLLKTGLDISKMALDGEVTKNYSIILEGLPTGNQTQDASSVDAPCAIAGCDRDSDTGTGGPSILVTTDDTCTNEELDSPLNTPESECPSGNSKQPPLEANEYAKNDAKLQIECKVVLKRLQMPPHEQHSTNIKCVATESETRRDGNCRRNSVKRWFPCEDYAEMEETDEPSQTSICTRNKKGRGRKSKPQNICLNYSLRSTSNNSRKEQETRNCSRSSTPEVSTSQPTTASSSRSMSPVTHVDKKEVEGKDAKMVHHFPNKFTLQRLKQQMEQKLAAIEQICPNIGS